LYLIGAHVLFIVVSSAGQDGVMLAVEMWQMLNSMAWMWPALAGFILMVNSDFPAKDMKEFISYAKANPGKLAYGKGSSGYLVSAAMLCELAGLQTVSVPYKGIPPAMTDLLGGQLQFAFADVGNAVSQMNGGRMRGLGVTTRKRAGKAPNVPSIGDTVKDYNVSAWFGLMAPAGLPAEAQPT
jgi:tripartite-type tricarboxylate transporter receptor subunit TctC